MLGETGCRLHYRSTDGVSRVVVLLGVRALDVSGFREGNIILSIMIHRAAEAKLKVEERLLRRLGWGDVHRFKGKWVFVLDASYGAEVIADCDEVECVEEATSRGKD